MPSPDTTYDRTSPPRHLSAPPDIYRLVQVRLGYGRQMSAMVIFGEHVHRRRKGSVVGGHHGECGAPAYKGGLGAEPPARSRGRAPGRPPEAESILAIECPTDPANLAPFQKCPFELRYTQQSP